MSQTPGNPNDPQDLENQFSDDTQPLSIDAPNEFYGYQADDTDDGFPMMAVILGGLVIFLTLAAIVYLAYTKGVQDGQRNLPPLVMADRDPVKVLPKSESGDDLAQQDLNIYKSIEAETPSSTSNAPEGEVGDGSVESLYATQESSAALDDDLADLDAFLGDGGVSEPSELSEPEAAQQEPLPPIPVEDIIAQNPPTVDEPAPVAPVISPADANHIVQISASRSVAQASATFTSLSRKFPDLLKNREPLVQRADLGDKGIFFRLGIGGFSSRAEAKSFCSSLKEKGQDCLVRKVD
ncbi:MAG: SPOR domain-containing protein [Parvibaculales bacterium]